MKPVLYAEDENADVFFLQYAWDQVAVANPLIAVRDGQQAIDYLAGQAAFADRNKFPLPCLLLLDLKLPVMTGFEVLQWIRQHPSLCALKVVILSGSDLEKDIHHAQTLGVTEYLVKPPTPLRLVDVLKERVCPWGLCKRQT